MPAALDDVLPSEQITQLARLISQVMASGFGTIEIEIVRGRVRFIRQQYSFEADYPGREFMPNAESNQK